MRDPIPEEVMQIAVSIGHVQYLHVLPFEYRAALSEAIAGALMKEREERDRLREENERFRIDEDRYRTFIRDVQMLAYKWQEAHDCLKSGLPYSFPSPTDLPECEAENARLRGALVGLTKAAAEVSKHGAQTGPQWVKLTAAVIGAKSTLRLLSKATDGSAS